MKYKLSNRTCICYKYNSKCFILWIDDFVVGDAEVPTTKLPPKPSLKGKPKAAPTKKDSPSDSDSSDDEPPGVFCDARI